jgi:C_GCAxxG_C_C family probable redox protein
MNQADRPPNDERVARASELARHNLVIEQFNCAESTFWAIMAALDLPLEPTLMCVATPFGGGIGDSGSICGALTGAVISLGVVLGRSSLDTPRKLVAYERTRQLYARFVAEAGSDHCSALNSLGFDRPDLRTFCSRFVVLSARLATEILLGCDPETDEVV